MEFKEGDKVVYIDGIDLSNIGKIVTFDKIINNHYTKYPFKVVDDSGSYCRVSNIRFPTLLEKELMEIEDWAFI